VLLLVSGRLAPAVARSVAALALLSCLAAPSAFSIETAAPSHSGAIPSVGPSHRASVPGGGGLGGLLDSPKPAAELSATLAQDANDYTWAAAVVGSNNAAGYQLASGAPVMAVGGFNGTDPAPALGQFQRLVATNRIHYFIRDRMMMIAGRWGASSGGSREAADIAQWVEKNYTPVVMDGVIVYDLSAPPRNS
jgi:hypothetical protein